MVNKEKFNEEPPPQQEGSNKGTCNEFRFRDRDTRTICGFLIGSRQVGIGAIRSAYLRACE